MPDFENIPSSSEGFDPDKAEKRKQRLGELTELHQSLSAEWKSLSSRHDALISQQASEANDDKMEDLIAEMGEIETQIAEIEKDIYILRQVE